ncbi:hypothetical protein C8Q80DRAFT_426865 [Daedaleopsis nitida]|nr:hypothetical protein C8Q80DRAFT_426865 [Daedaleopsis nitida]
MRSSHTSPRPLASSQRVSSRRSAQTDHCHPALSLHTFSGDALQLSHLLHQSARHSASNTSDSIRQSSSLTSCVLKDAKRCVSPPTSTLFRPQLTNYKDTANLTQPRNRTRAARPLRPAQTIRASSASSPSTGAVFPTRTRRGDGGSHSDLARRGASVRCAATCSLESGHEAPSSRLASRIVPERARPSLPSPPPSDQRPAGTVCTSTAAALSELRTWGARPVYPNRRVSGTRRCATRSVSDVSKGDEGGGSRSDSAPAVPARTALRSLSFALTAARS